MFHLKFPRVPPEFNYWLIYCTLLSLSLVLRKIFCIKYASWLRFRTFPGNASFVTLTLLFVCVKTETCCNKSKLINIFLTWLFRPSMHMGDKLCWVFLIVWWVFLPFVKNIYILAHVPWNIMCVSFWPLSNVHVSNWLKNEIKKCFFFKECLANTDRARLLKRPGLDTHPPYLIVIICSSSVPSKSR